MSAAPQPIARNCRRFEKNTLRAFFDIELPSGMIIRGATLQFSHGKYWVGLPARPFENSEGVKGWVPIIDFRDRETKARFQTAAIAAATEAFPELAAKAEEHAE